MTVAETSDFDPRYERAQTIDGAKARYVSDDFPDYGETMLEGDIDRLLREGEYPDKDDEPTLEGCTVHA